MKKIAIGIGVIIMTLGLSGCGSNDSSDSVGVGFGDTFSMQIPEGFESINPKLVENKQITNKVLLSYKKENEEIFDDNIVVTRSEIGPSLDYEQFRTVNSKKLQTSLAGYIPGEQKKLSFYCNEEEIDAIYVTFDVKNTFSNIQELTYISQMQFVHEEKGYIMSYAGVDEKDRNNSVDRLTDITCPQSS